MTSQLRNPSGRNGAPLFYAGWAGFALFGSLVTIDGNAEVSYAVSHVLVAAAICIWHAMTTGKAAPIVGAVLGALFGLQMAFFVISDNFISAEPLKVKLEDAFGLLAAVLILIGVVLDLRGRRTAVRLTRATIGGSSDPSRERG